MFHAEAWEPPEREREREERQGRRFPYYAASPLRAAVAAGSPSSLTPLSVASTWNQIYTRRQLVQRSEIHTCKIKAWGMDGCTSLFQPVRLAANRFLTRGSKLRPLTGNNIRSLEGIFRGRNFHLHQGKSHAGSGLKSASSAPLGAWLYIRESSAGFAVRWRHKLSRQQMLIFRCSQI